MAGDSAIEDMFTSEADTSPRTEQEALETGFAQGVQALRRTLNTTPAGWLLVGYMSWNRAPHPTLYGWLALFFVLWIISVGVLARMARKGVRLREHAAAVLAVAAIDGAAWGLMFVMLTGHDEALDAWLGAVVAGVAAVNAPVYITIPRCYRVQIASMWVVAMLASAFQPERSSVLNTLAGLTVFMALIAYYMSSISQRVLEGIRLQLANAELARRLRMALDLASIDASTDALTGLLNRRALDRILQQLIENADAEGKPLSLLLLDLDHFKRINDTHGHAVGDAALKAFVARVREVLRSNDVMARYGGEEFVVVLPGASLQTAVEVAERIRTRVEASPLLAEPLLSVTTSIGAADRRAGETIGPWFERADGAVYAAKRAGRNRVCTQSHEAGPPQPSRDAADDPPWTI